MCSWPSLPSCDNTPPIASLPTSVSRMKDTTPPVKSRRDRMGAARSRFLRSSKASSWAATQLKSRLADFSVSLYRGVAICD